MTQIDRVREEGMKAAEKRCRKLHMGEVDFSPTMVAAGRKVELYKLVWRKKQGQGIKSTKIRRLAAKLNIPRPLSVSLEEAEELYKQALEEYHVFKPDAAVFRYDFLVSRKDDPKATEEDRKAAERLLSKEKARETSRHLRRIKNNPNLGAISRVEVPSDDGTSSIIHDTQETVEQAIMDSIEKRYRLAYISPFLQEPLRSQLGLTGTSAEAKQILDGTFQCPDEMDETTKTIIHLLQRPFAEIEQVASTISREDYQKYWKKAKESTSSSYSGLHFGHWKAAADCEDLSEVHSLFTEIATSSGYVPPQMDVWSHRHAGKETRCHPCG